MGRVLVLEVDEVEAVDAAQQQVGHHHAEYDAQEEVEGELGEVDALQKKRSIIKKLWPCLPLSRQIREKMHGIDSFPLRCYGGKSMH